MNLEKLLASRHTMAAFIGVATGILALIILEEGDDFIPSIFFAGICIAAGIFVIMQLNTSFAALSVPVFCLGVFAFMYGVSHGFYEDLAELFIGLCAAAGFIIALVSLFMILKAHQNTDESENKHNT